MAERMLDNMAESKGESSKENDKKRKGLAGPASSKKLEPPKSQNVADLFAKMENHMSQSLRAMEQRQTDRLQNVSNAVGMVEERLNKFQENEKKREAEREREKKKEVEKEYSEREGYGNDFYQGEYDQGEENQEEDDQYYEDDHEEYDQQGEDHEDNEEKEKKEEKEKNYELEFFEDSKNSVMVSEDQVKAWKRV